MANSNATFLSEHLFEIGIEVGEQLVVSDDPTAIRTALVRLRPVYDVVIVTGGLGPTEDDRTVDVVSDLLGVDSPADAASLDAMKQRFSTHGFDLTPQTAAGAHSLLGVDSDQRGHRARIRIRLAGVAYFLPVVARDMEKCMTG